MPTNLVEVGPDRPVYSFNRAFEPRARVAPGTRVRFTTSDAPYRGLTGEALDAGTVSVRLLNALAGPVVIDGAEPGDALAITIEAIELGELAFAPYVSRWGSTVFGIRGSSVESYSVADDRVALGGGAFIRVRSMIGCAGVAPAEGELSSLSPTGPTGGNMDLVELATGATLWLPVEVSGALVALGDFHAAMGRGEPTGAGLECAGSATVRLELAKAQPLPGPRIETSTYVAFVGTDPRELDRAIEAAIGAAWVWLRTTCNLEPRRALTLCSALLDVDLGGPAGANAIARFDRDRLADAGVVI